MKYFTMNVEVVIIGSHFTLRSHILRKGISIKNIQSIIECPLGNNCFAKAVHNLAKLKTAKPWFCAFVHLSVHVLFDTL